MSEEQVLQKEEKRVKLVFDEAKCPSVYATNIAVQFTGHEFVISFYEARPPLILGPMEQRLADFERLDSVRADCVARITVAAPRMPGFVKALQEHLHKFSPSAQEEE